MSKSSFLGYLMRCFGLIILFSFLIAFFAYRVTYFNFHIYDETYYASAAQAIYKGELDTEKTHPPLAKWLISIPMHYLGDSWSLSWRLASLVFGLAGLMVTYLFARRIGLSYWQGVLAVLMLVATKSWYILSRVAMTDIFLSLFVLIAAYFLYIFMVEGGFGRRAKDYRKWWSYWAFCVVSGIAGATKWSGFFPLIFFVMPFWWFYIQEPRVWRIKMILTSGALSLFVYSAVSISLLQFDVSEFISRNGLSFVTHNSSMLPENNPEDHQARGGFDAFWRYFVFDQGYALIVEGYSEARFSNNHMVAVGLVVVVLVYALCFIGKIVRFCQKIEFKCPDWFIDKRIIFLIFYALSLMAPWAIIPRNQYIYYFVPAFPMLLLSFITLSSYFDKKLQIFLLLMYIGLFIHGIRYTVPL